jgi:hypothetical protein
MSRSLSHAAAAVNQCTKQVRGDDLCVAAPVAAQGEDEAVALVVSEEPLGAAAEPLGKAGDSHVALVGYDY